MYKCSLVEHFIICAVLNAFAFNGGVYIDYINLFLLVCILLLRTTTRDVHNCLCLFRNSYQLYSSL